MLFQVKNKSVSMVHYHYQPIEDSAVVNPHISTQSQPLKLLINEEKAQIQMNLPCCVLPVIALCPLERTRSPLWETDVC